jgi:hypothetical protein
MLIDRILDSPDDQLLYHYCSAVSFQAILASGKLRFTDINMLNDSTEHRWGYSIFEEAATRLLSRKGLSDTVPTMTIDFFNAVDQILSGSQLRLHPFVSCLSLEPNSLDQWRKYGDDGRGFAIGFRTSAMQRMAISLLKVSYGREEQISEMMTALLAIHASSSEPQLPLAGEAYEDAEMMAALMVAFKHPSFQSEKEVRCLRAISLENVGGNFRFIDHGGQTTGGESLPGEVVSFNIRDGALTAFVDLPFSAKVENQAVAEVALGPKNPSGTGNVFLFLGSLGYSNIAVRPSDIPYR